MKITKHRKNTGKQTGKIVRNLDSIHSRQNMLRECLITIEQKWDPLEPDNRNRLHQKRETFGICYRYRQHIRGWAKQREKLMLEKREADSQGGNSKFMGESSYISPV